MNKKLLNIGIAVLGIAPSIAGADPLSKYYDPLFASPPPCESIMSEMPVPGTEMMEAEQLPPYLHNLNLTDTQIESIRELVQKNKAEIRQKSKTGTEYFVDINNQVFSNDYAEDKIAALIKKTLPFHEQMALNMAKLDRAIFELLSPEQQQELSANLINLFECVKETE